MELLSSLIIATFIIELVHAVTKRLDRYYDWQERPLKRAGLQLLLGVVLPGIVDFGLAAVYFQFFGLNIIRDTTYAIYAFPLVVALIFMFNLYYLCLYLFLKMKSADGGNRKKETILVQQGARFIPLAISEIHYIYHQKRMNYLVTGTNKTYFLNETLDEMESLLPPRDFFRVNRRMIIRHVACTHFQSHEHGKLLLQLEPPYSESVTVSQTRAKAFRKWIYR